MGAQVLLNPQFLMPLAGLGLSIPFLGRQQQGEDNIYGGINFGASSTTSNPFQNLLNLGKKDTFAEDFLQGKLDDKYPMSSEAVQDLKDAATLFNKDGEYIGGVLPSGIVENKPTTMLSEQNQILGADGQPISGTSSITFDNTDISSNNNNNNNNKDGNNFNKLLYGSLLINPLIEGGKYVFDKAKDIFGKKDDKDDKDDDKSDFEDITGITYEKAMEMQRKRENELMNRKALEGGLKDAGKYMYLAGAAGMEAGKNIGRNTQDKTKRCKKS